MKKILDFIFETVPEDENEEVVLEAPLEKHTFGGDMPKKEVIKKETIKKVPIPKKEIVNVDNNVAKTKIETSKNTDILTKKSTFKIDIDTDSKKEKPKVVKSRNITNKKETRYEFQPPISPIFGVLESHEDPRIIIPQNNKTTTIANNSYLGTVLSPIYGSNINQKEEDLTEKIETEEFIKEVNEEIKEENNIFLETETIEEINLSDIKEQAFEEYFKDEIKDEDITNLSIEDILVKPNDETQIINREISLFDDEEE